MVADKYAVIITGGYSPSNDIIKKYTNDADYIITADSGFDIAVNYNIQVDYVIGDMDSVQQRDKLDIFPIEKKEIVSHEKDETDTELAINKVWGMGFRDIVLIGGGGGRLDHIIGILWLFEREIRPSIWITDNETVILITNSFHGSAEIGDLISLFPLSDDIEGLSSKGLKWSLEGLKWGRGDMGLHNEAVENNFSVELKRGKLLMIRKNKLEKQYV